MAVSARQTRSLCFCSSIIRRSNCASVGGVTFRIFNTRLLVSSLYPPTRRDGGIIHLVSGSRLHGLRPRNSACPLGPRPRLFWLRGWFVGAADGPFAFR